MKNEIKKINRKDFILMREVVGLIEPAGQRECVGEGFECKMPKGACGHPGLVPHNTKYQPPTCTSTSGRTACKPKFFS